MSNAALPPLVDEQFDINQTLDSIDHLSRFAREHPDIFRIHSPVRERDDVVAIRPDYAKHVLLDNRRGYGKGSGFGRVKLLLGNSIIASDGDVWHRNRLMIQPAFQRAALDKHLCKLVRANVELSRRWRETAEQNQPIAVTNDTSELALENVLLALFSIDLNRFVDAHGHNALWLVNEVHERDLKFALRFRQLSEPVLELIQWRRRTGAPRDDILGLVMQARDRETGEPMADKQLVDEMLMLVVAGHETTASALNSCWHLIAHHTEVQERLFDETLRWKNKHSPVISKLATGEAISVREALGLTELRYTRQVIEEAMRLYPPGWAFSRRALDDDQIGGFHIPKGTDVLVTPFLTHRHPQYWLEPERFNPDRFDPEHSPTDRFSFLPFSAGPRRCIGDVLAMLEMQLHIGLVAPELEFIARAPLELPIVAQINLRGRDPLTMAAQPRQPIKLAKKLDI